MQTTGREDRLPFPRSWWIDPGRIIGGRYPGTADVAESRAILAQLLDVGVRLVVNLQEVVELGQGERPFRDYAPDLLGLAAERGVDVQVRRFPVPDMGVPDAGQMGQILHEMAAAVTDGRRAYVHCWGGHGRTGMVAGCWLLAAGCWLLAAGWWATARRPIHRPSPRPNGRSSAAGPDRTARRRHRLR